LTIINVLRYPLVMETSNGAEKPLPAQEAGCCARETVGAATLDPSQSDMLAARLKALADPTRLRMLDLLTRHSAPLCVCEINEHFAQRQPTISHHLRILRQAGLVDCEKRGVWAYYWSTRVGSEWLSAMRALTL
jgi:ArsR family transcriptional regulator, arsenate/arsenite/antimonite-responsive transcriptional repressor